jgi:Beta protein
MLSIETQNYAVILRDKVAEFDALRSLDRANKNMILPYFVAASFFVKDQEKKRQVTKEECRDDHLGRLAKSWGRRSAILDTRFLKFAQDLQQDAVDLSNFLEASTQYGCSLIPALDLRTSELRRNAISAFWQKTNHGLAIRVTLSDLLNPKLAISVQRLLLQVVAKPQNCVLVLDLADADLSDLNAFAAFEAEWVLRTQELGLWRRVIVAATHYPEKNPAPPNGQIEVGRNEWLAWKQAVGIDARVGELAMFGDYGADNARISFGETGFGAITHFRYATKDKWLVVRGGSPVPAHDGSIHEVARRILISGVFAGELFSWGDEFIKACAEAKQVGNPTIWRTANMNHHMTRVTQDLADFFEIQMPAPVRRTPIQQDMFFDFSQPR